MRGFKKSLSLVAYFAASRSRPFARAVRGWFRAIEITYNEDADTYHPHIHAILVVENAYFYKNSPLYLTQPTWEKMWRESLRVNYNPRVDVRSTYGKGGKTRKAKKERGEVLEAAKYAIRRASAKIASCHALPGPPCSPGPV